MYYVEEVLEGGIYPHSPFPRLNLYEKPITGSYPEAAKYRQH